MLEQICGRGVERNNYCTPQSAGDEIEDKTSQESPCCYIWLPRLNPSSSKYQREVEVASLRPWLSHCSSLFSFFLSFPTFSLSFLLTFFHFTIKTSVCIYVLLHWKCNITLYISLSSTHFTRVHFQFDVDLVPADYSCSASSYQLPRQVLSCFRFHICLARNVHRKQISDLLLKADAQLHRATWALRWLCFPSVAALKTAMISAVNGWKPAIKSCKLASYVNH